MDGEPSATPLFKRKKLKNRDSTASLRNLGGSAPATPSGEANGEALGDEGNVAIIRSKKGGAATKLKERERQRSRLSFGADGDADDQEEATGEASSSQRRLLRPQEGASLSTLNSSGLPATSTSRPSYSASDLADLRSRTLATPPPSKSPEDSYGDLTRSKFGSLALSGESGDDQPVESRVPTSSAISAAKERRQLARKTGIDPNSLGGNTDDGFISLSTSVVPAGASKGGESRLVREEDEIGEGEDEHAEYTGASERVALGRKAGLAAERKRREGMVELIDDAEAEDDEAMDEEDRAWEAEQVRRAGAWSGTASDAPPSKVHRSAPIPEQSALPTIAALQARINGVLQEAIDLETEQSALATQLAREDEDLAEKEAELREGVEVSEAKDSWSREFHGFVEDVAQFLRAKWPALEKAEADRRSILKERADMVTKRRLAEISDDLARWSDKTVPVKIPSLEDTAGDDEDGDRKMDEGDVDELGRVRPEKDLSADGPLRLSRREDRKSRRQRRAALRSSSTVDEEEEGFSTDDDLPTADAADLAAASTSLAAASAAIFADVANAEFREPSASGGLADHFADWRRRYPDDYRNAFGGLALVQAWEFWARVEMSANWNVWGAKEWASPEGGVAANRSLEGWQWMKGLDEYEHRLAEGQNGTAGPPIEPESLVGAMVTSVVVPLLAQLGKTSYDPYSAVATGRALKLIEEVSYVLDQATSGAYESLILAFTSRFQTAVAELQYVVGATIAGSPSRRRASDPEKDTARRRVLAKGTKLLQQGLRWRRPAKGILLSGADGAIGGGATLERFLGSELVGRALLPLMEHGPAGASTDIARRVSKLCPFGVLDDEVARRIEAVCSITQ